MGGEIKAERLNHWLQRRGRWFAGHGTAVVFWGWIVPGVRPYWSLPAGIECMPLGPFLCGATAGHLIRVVARTLAESALGAMAEGANDAEVMEGLLGAATPLRDGVLLQKLQLSNRTQAALVGRTAQLGRLSLPSPESNSNSSP